MKKNVKRVALLLVAVVAIVAIVRYGCSRKNETQLGFRQVPVQRTNIVQTVVATGTVTPRNTKNGIPVGAQVNGKLIELFVDYNSTVTNGQVVAKIDPLVYEASYKSAKAQLEVNLANAEVKRAALRSVEAELALAEKTFARKEQLVAKALAPQSDLDSALEARERAASALDQAKAALMSAEASVAQARATAAKAEADLAYCTIVSPVDGIVIDRKVEKGETVVSSMNAVPLLTIAEDLKTVWIEAKIPEAEIGSIRVGQPVTFTADAYRQTFTGKVRQIRKASTTTNNVVTFPVVIEAENPDEMLFPGMTATLTIETARKEGVVAVAAAALRFRPKDEDLANVKGEVPNGSKIWLRTPDGALEPVAVREGISDGSFVAVSSVDSTIVLEGREAVIGYEQASAAKAGGKDGDKEKNPFMPKMPKHGTKGTAPAPKR